MFPEVLSSPKMAAEWSGVDGGPRDAVTGLSAPCSPAAFCGVHSMALWTQVCYILALRMPGSRGAPYRSFILFPENFFLGRLSPGSSFRQWSSAWPRAGGGGKCTRGPGGSVCVAPPRVPRG